MLYVMNKFLHLKKLENLMNSVDCVEYYFPHLTDRPDLVLFLKYLYSIQTVTGIFFDFRIEEVPKPVLSLLQSLDIKQLQSTTFELEFYGLPFWDDAAVINFSRNDSHNTMYIMLHEANDCHSKLLQLVEKMGNFLYRLHLKSIAKDLGGILNTISACCPQLNCLIMSDGGDSCLDYSPSNEAIVQNCSIKRLEMRNFHITLQTFTLISKQFPCLDLVLDGFNNWKGPGSYFPMIAPSMSIGYFRLRLDCYTDIKAFIFGKVFIKLETADQETRYYDLNSKSPEYVVENYLYLHINSTEADYQKSIKDQSCMTLFIKFKSVAKFVPTLSRSRRREDLSLKLIYQNV